MSVTIDTLADKMAAALGEDYNDFDTKEVFQDYLIEAIDFILADKSWPFGRLIQTFPSVATVDSYTVDTNMADVRVVFDTDNNRVLSYFDHDTLLHKNVDYDLTGTPSKWYWKTATDGVFIIGFWPVPVAEVNYNIYGDKQAENLVGTSTVPLPPAANIALRHYVYGLYKESVGDYAGAQLSGLRFGTAYALLTKRYQAPVARVRRFKNRDVPTPATGMLAYPDTIPAP